MRNDETSESIPPEKKDIFCDDVIFSPDLSIRVDYQVIIVKINTIFLNRNRLVSMIFAKIFHRLNLIEED